MPTSLSPAYTPETKAMRKNSRAARFLRMWREDYIYQTLINAAVSFGCTALFALHNGYLGLCYDYGEADNSERKRNAASICRLQRHNLCGNFSHYLTHAAKRIETIRHSCSSTAHIKHPMLCFVRSTTQHGMFSFIGFSILSVKSGLVHPGR